MNSFLVNLTYYKNTYPDPPNPRHKTVTSFWFTGAFVLADKYWKPGDQLVRIEVIQRDDAKIQHPVMDIILEYREIQYLTDWRYNHHEQTGFLL